MTLAGRGRTGARTGTSADRVWEHDGIKVHGGRLTVAGRDAEDLARRHGTPLYAVDLQRVGERVRMIQGALARAGLRYLTRLALKAQREPEVLRFVRGLGAPGDSDSVGMDVSSPGEALHAIAHGWLPEEISYTGTNVSERDLDVIAGLPIHINVDLLTQIERLGRRCPGRSIGLRINPRAGAQHGREEGDSFYSGTKPTKFGIFREDLDRALDVAQRFGLIIDTVHIHVANLMYTDKLPAFERAIAATAEMARHLIDHGCPIKEINTGGGLGVPLAEGQTELDLDQYAGILKKHLGGFEAAVAVEPGEFLVDDCAVLLAEVVSVEERLGTVFVGLDVGWNVLCDRFVYGHDQQVVVCRAADARRTLTATVAGHINEGDDLFVEDYGLPPVVEGDIVAMMETGGYNQAQMSCHCLRPHARAVYFEERV